MLVGLNRLLVTKVKFLTIYVETLLNFYALHYCMPLDTEKLKDLSNPDKIKKLREFEEERLREIEEAEMLIWKLQSNEDSAKAPEDIKMPEVKPIDISELFLAAQSNTLEAQAAEAVEMPSKEDVALMMYSAGEGIIDKVDYMLNIPEKQEKKKEFDVRKYANIAEANASIATAFAESRDIARFYRSD